MAKGWEVKHNETNKFWELLDDGYVYSRHRSEEDAIHAMGIAKKDEEIGDAISEGVDFLLDSLKEKFPDVAASELKSRIVENL